VDSQPQATCAVSVDRHEQSATINQVMAALVASYVERLLNGTCTWMASYIDMESGAVRCVSADPRQVAAVVGLHANALVRRKRVRSSDEVVDELAR
jgi:hypothetical protein